MYDVFPIENDDIPAIHVSLPDFPGKKLHPKTPQGDAIQRISETIAPRPFSNGWTVVLVVVLLMKLNAPPESLTGNLPLTNDGLENQCFPIWDGKLSGASGELLNFQIFQGVSC